MEQFLVRRTARRYLLLKWMEAKRRCTVEWRSSMWKTERWGGEELALDVVVLQDQVVAVVLFVRR
jgi:hypothetical protein